MKETSVPYEQKVITLECGILLHSWVIGLPSFFLGPNSKEEAQPKPPVTVQ
jgi:hypothetical protein